MSSPKSLFILGASGYIGGAILARLLETYPEAQFYVQYRQEAHEQILKKFSKQITPVKASLSDLDTLEKYAAQSDVVVTAADCDDVPSAKAIIKGLESAAQGRLDSKQPKAVLIHTSGTGVLVDSKVPSGELDETDVHDVDEKQIEAIPVDRPHREVDIVVTDAFKRGHFLGYIVLPSTIYGRGDGPIHTTSQQVPNAIYWALTKGRAEFIEPGQNVWANVHIHTLSELYVSLAKLLLSPSNPSPPHNPWTQYIFAAGPEFHSWKELAIKAGSILKDLGELQEGGAVGITREEYKGPEQGYATKAGALQGSNSRAVAERAKELVGWVETKNIYDYLEEDIKDAVNEWKA